MVGLLLMAPYTQADSVSIIELQSRPAADVIPIIQPMLSANDAISGEGFKIFLRSSPDTVADVREMIELLDAPLQVLEISVFQGSEWDLRRLAGSASVQVDSGNGQIDVGDKGNNDAAGSIHVDTSNGRATVSGSISQGTLRDAPVHRVRVTEGTEAYIQTGQQIPYIFSTGGSAHREFTASVEYRNAGSGFYVLPRVRSDIVVLEISPFKSKQFDTGPGDVVAQSASTTITGQIGDWLLIGGVSEQIERTDSVMGTTIQTQSGRDSGVWIRAELVQ